MRILFVSNYYPPYEVGGYEQLCRDVAKRLAARGHAIAALTSDYGSKVADSDTENGVYRRLKLRPTYKKLPGPAVEFFVSRRANLRHNVRWLNRVLDDYRPEIVFIWNLQRLPRELAVVCEDREDIAVAYWLAGYTPAEPDEYWLYWENEPARQFVRLLKRPVRSLALSMLAGEGMPVRPVMAHTAVVSNYMKEKGITDSTLPANTQVIYNGVEVSAFYRTVKARGKGPLRVLVAGRVSGDKGIHTIVEALAFLKQLKRDKQMLLHVAGTGPPEYEHSLRKLIARHELGRSIEMLGYLPRDEMPQLMSRCHALVLPSIYPEAFSRVVLEAMVSGLAVIGSTSGGTTELLEDGVNGLTFEAENSLELAQKLAKLIDDDGLRQKLAHYGQQQVAEAFNMGLMVDRIEKFLKGALEVG